jgi:hypothetical protein
MEQQVCQFQTVSTKGFTPRLCAFGVPFSREMARLLDPRESQGGLTANQLTTAALLGFETVRCATCRPDFESNPPARMLLDNVSSSASSQQDARACSKR